MCWSYVPPRRRVGTDADMLDFPLDLAYSQLASDEGPPFGEAGVTHAPAGELLDMLAPEVLRPN